MPHRAVILMFALIAAFATLAPARAQDSPSVAVNQIDAANYPKVTAVVTVLDASGVPVSNLTAPQFAAIVGDEAGAITSVQSAQDATLRLSVTLVIDVSGSMEGAPLAAAKEAASAFVQSLGPNDEAALLSFAGAVTPVVPFTNDKAALAQGIAGLQALGPTALYDAVQSAVFAANSSDAPRKAIVLLSDGENDAPGSPSTDIGSLAAARDAKVPVFAIGFGAAPGPYLRLLADETRGQFRTADASDIGTVYQSIAQLLRSQYVVTFDGPGEADGADALLRIEADIAGTIVSSPPVPFKRGIASAAPTAAPTTAPAAPAAADDAGGGAPLALIFAIAVVAVALIGGAIFFVRRRRAANAQRERERVSGRQSDQAVPPPLVVAPALTPNGARGRIVSLDPQTQGTAFHFGDEPIIIGSGTNAHVRVPVARDVATRHAVIWLKDGKIMLRHVGGSARRTVVAGKPVEWVILDEGDEFTVGAHRYRAEIAAAGTGDGA